MRKTSKKISIQSHASYQGQIKKGFNENDARYSCCRGKYHLRKGAVIVGIVELVAVLMVIVYCIVAYLCNGFYKKLPKIPDPLPRKRSLLILALAMSIIACLLWSVCVGLMAWGIKKCKPSMLIPHMMLQVLAIISLAGLTALFIWWVVDVNDDRQTEAEDRIKIAFSGWDPRFRADQSNVLVATIVFSFLAVASLIGVVVEIFFFIVVRRCYRFLCTKMSYHQHQQRKLSQSQRSR